jgi:hypothetical protein
MCMIWAIGSQLEVLPDSGIGDPFAMEVQEVSERDPNVIARHRVCMPDGRTWEVCTRRTDFGFTTTCGSLHGPVACRTDSGTRHRAIQDHFDHIAHLITCILECDCAA